MLSRIICAILVEGIMRTNSLKYFEFGPVVQEISFKRVFIWSSGSPPVQWSRTIYAIFVKRLMRNISMKLFGIWTSGSEEEVV